MSTLRANSRLFVRSLAISLAIGLIVATPARAQYPFGAGFAYPGLGYGYPGLGYGYSGLGYGYSGLGYGPYGGYSNLGFGVGTVTPGYGTVVGGFGYPTPFGVPGYGYGYGAPGYGPYGVGYANPLFSLGLSPLAVRTAIAERTLLGPPATIHRQVQPGVTILPGTPSSGTAGTRSNPSAR